MADTAYSEDQLATARAVSTATLTTVLLKKGLRNVWIRGAFPLAPGQARVAGPAFTLRFVPMREDMATPASWGNPVSTRAAIEAMPQGSVAVIDAGGVKDAGVFGDILCLRMAVRGVGAMVTDGVVRDLEGVLGAGLPVWAAGTCAPASIAGITFAGWGDLIGCGGVAVASGDLVVADRDGAVVVPMAMVDEILAAAAVQEAEETWIADQVRAGEALPGLYPMNEATRRRYEGG